MNRKLIVTETGKIVDSESYELAEKIDKLRRKKNPWLVIDELVRSWTKRAPEEVQALKIDISDQKETLYDKKYGQTKGGKDMERRATLIFPMGLQLLIRTQYKADELPMDRKFYREFIKRYPNFSLTESA